jgi:hypothetical protein
MTYVIPNVQRFEMSPYLVLPTYVDKATPEVRLRTRRVISHAPFREDSRQRRQRCTTTTSDARNLGRKRQRFHFFSLGTEFVIFFSGVHVHLLFHSGHFSLSPAVP